MRIWAGTYQTLLISLAVGALVVSMVSTHARSFVQAAEPEMKIEVTMKDKECHVKRHTTPGVLTAIVLRNEDTVTHGFSSTLFKQVKVRKEGDAVEVMKKGVKSFHVDPGKTATLY